MEIGFKTIGPLILIFAIAVIILTVTGTVIQDVKDDQLTEATSTITVTNETVTGNGTLAFTGALGRTSNIDNTTIIVANSTNSSLDATLVGWAVLEDTGALNRMFQSSGNVVNVTYNYYAVAPEAAVNVSTEGLTGITNLGERFGNAGTVLGAALILSILLGAFAFYRIQSGGGGVSFQ